MGQGGGHGARVDAMHLNGRHGGPRRVHVTHDEQRIAHLDYAHAFRRGDAHLVTHNADGDRG